jgi:anti-sigma factor RsiW
MNCDAAELLLHGLIDREIDSGEIEAHIQGCTCCAARLGAYRALHEAMSKVELRLAPPIGLRATILARLRPATGRSIFARLALAPALSAIAAALLMLAVLRPGQDDVLVSDVVSAHLRSLEASHLTDVQAGDQAVVRPWFSAHLGAAPPIPDLTQQGFELVGGRIDYVLGKPVAAIAYRRDDHIINLFVAQGGGVDRDVRVKATQGLNLELWSEHGLNMCAVGDVSVEALQTLHDAFEAASADKA